METPEPDAPATDVDDQDAEPTKTAEMIEQEPERDQAEGEDD
jgi:hypothetical protein